MSDDLIEHDKFVFGYPVWIIVEPDDFQKRGLPFAARTIESIEQGEFLPVFTDEDLAVSLIEAANAKTKVACEVKTPRELRDVLIYFQEGALQNVGIDLSKGRARLYQITELLETFPPEPG
jgi:hypothetical protein